MRPSLDRGVHLKEPGPASDHRIMAANTGWDDDLARDLVGKRVLIGITFTGSVRETTQRHGTIVETDEDRGVAIELADEGEVFWLPPDVRAFRPARPGNYRLRSTGEIVVDPDLTTTWTIADPVPEDDTPQRAQARAEQARRFGFPS
jgi:hypothetical protein